MHQTRPGRAPEAVTPARPGPLGHARPPAQVVPGVAAIDGPPQATSRPAALQVPGQSAPLPQGRIEDPRVTGVHAQVRRPRVLASVQDQLPAGAAVAGAVDATL